MGRNDYESEIEIVVAFKHDIVNNVGGFDVYIIIADNFHANKFLTQKIKSKILIKKMLMNGLK